VVVNGDGLQASSTALQSFNLVSEGPERFLVHVTSHVTVNANGETTVEVVRRTGNAGTESATRRRRRDPASGAALLVANSVSSRLFRSRSVCLGRPTIVHAVNHYISFTRHLLGLGG